MSTLRSLPLHNLSTRPTVGALIAALTLACGCPAQSHLETNYADTNTEGARPYLFGDPFGIRSALAHKGITFIFESITDAMGVAHGGLSDQPAAYTRIRGTVDIDFGKLTGTVSGLSFHATGLWQTGDNIGPKLGSYADPSGFASVHVFRMDSFWLQKQFADGAVTLRAGQMAGWDFFGNQEYGGSFTIESLSYAPGNIFGATYLTT
jgi:carbohydrate-selective porin OprB